ncbi:hypothetical protein MMAD_32060 [Mycolicibacterium madagascariense]|uniref:Uncharacterized protein n=1 Tax=Mycolicibacterium madagascariense TaxID=212765 RepID=A0A7I7XI80_9MYCO|nr:hypothetical protein MMAD_32060 [Mycolicibacterium madagascariense]
MSVGAAEAPVNAANGAGTTPPPAATRPTGELDGGADADDEAVDDDEGFDAVDVPPADVDAVLGREVDPGATES